MIVKFNNNNTMKTKTNFFMEILISAVLGGCIGFVFYYITGNIIAPMLCSVGASTVAIHRVLRKNKIIEK